MRRALSLVGLTLVPGLAFGGIHIPMKNGQSLALPASTVRCLVAEFLDPEQTGLGEPTALVVGGELLDAVRSVRGAGVLVMTDRERKGIVAKLGKGYNRAALAIAGEQKAMVAVWGMIEGSDSSALIETYVSQAPDSAGVGRVQLEWAGRPIDGVSAVTSSRSLRFVPRLVQRRVSYRRPLVVLNGERPVHTQADRGAPTIVRLTEGQSVLAEDIQGFWWRVRLPDGRTGWLEHDDNDVRVPPREVEAPEKVQIKLLDRPDGTPTSGKQGLLGIYPVLDAQYGASGLWVQISTAQVIGWVPARLFRARYDLPVVQFIAGLYHYRGRRFVDAAERFQAFIDQAGPKEDNVTLSAAHQLLGLSRLQARPSDRDALQEFDRAVELTPFDARARAIRAFGSITAWGEIREDCIRDLASALELDGNDRTTQELVIAIRRLQMKPPDQREQFGTMGRSAVSRAEDVDRLYGKVAQYPDSIFEATKFEKGK